MDISKIFTLAGILIPACIFAYVINKKTTKVTQTTWFVRSPYWWQWYQPYPYTWQGYVIACLFVVSAVFTFLSGFLLAVPLFFLLLFVYIFISYKMSTKKGGKNPNVSTPSTFNPNISLFPQKSLFFVILDKLLLVIIAAIILALGIGFCFVTQCRLH